LTDEDLAADECKELAVFFEDTIIELFFDEECKEAIEL
jgi:hypothetical protein